MGKANCVSFDAGQESSHVMSQHDPVGGECKILGISFDTKLTMHDAVADLVKECGWKKTVLLRCKASIFLCWTNKHNMLLTS